MTIVKEFAKQELAKMYRHAEFTYTNTNVFDQSAVSSAIESVNNQEMRFENNLNHSFQASYRGRRLPDYPKLDTTRISQLGLMISDKQEGNFRLEVQRIALYFNEHFQT